MKLINIIHKIYDKIKELWNIYGGIALSTLIAYVTRWSKNSMEIWSSYITLTITCIGLLTFFKFSFTKSKKNKTDKVVLSANKQVKQINSAIEPNKVGQELGEAIIYSYKEGKRIMTKLKKVFKWLWGNKVTLTSIISNLFFATISQYLLYSDTLKEIEFFQVHDITTKVISTIVAVIWLILNIYSAINHLGLENLDALKKRSEEKKQEAISKLSKEQKVALKTQLNLYKKQYTEIKAKVKEVSKKLEFANVIISQFQLLTSQNISPLSEQEQQYHEALNTKNNCVNDLSLLNSKMKNVEISISNLKAKL